MSTTPYISYNTRTALSNPSFTSDEADDERSFASLSETGSDGQRTMAQHDEEDTRPTSEKELRGFYSYGWASEVFVICGMGSFIPITLEQLAREKGVWSTDHVTPCTVGLESPSSGTSTTARPEPAQCILPIFGTEINTASFAMYTFSISVLLQSLLIISMSGAADHGRYRKQLLLMFAFLGATATMMFLPLSPNVLLLAAVCAIIANTCYGASSVLLNSFLPVLVRNHPDAAARHDDFDDNSGRNSTYEDEPLLDDSIIGPDASSLHRTSRPVKHYHNETRDLSVSTKISSYGIGIGYVAALLVQASSIAIVKSMNSTLLSLRVVLFIIGLWWLLFTIPSAIWLRPRPGPPLHLPPSTTSIIKILLAYTSYSWNSLGRSILRARQLRDVLLFLAAWFLLSDAIATVSGTAVLFAKTSLQMQPAALALINVIVTISGIAGAFLWRRISHLMHLQPIQTILSCILLFELVPLYGLAGYLPVVQRLGVGGLQQPWEMYPVASIYGFILGGLSSFCRALFGDLVPPGFEAAFYSLYAITDKGSSVFGPAVVGAITDRTGQIRPAFAFLAVLIAAPFPILLCVDVERGKRDGIALARELAGTSTGSTVEDYDEEEDACDVRLGAEES